MKREKKSKLDRRIFIFLYCMVVVTCGIWYSEYRHKTEITESFASVSEIPSLEVESTEEPVLEAESSATDDATDATDLPPQISEEETNLTQTEKTDSVEQTQSDKININTADVQTLTALPGIGEKIAANIIAYRERAGGFGSIEEIMNVDRIGKKTFEKIKDLITVE